MWRKIRKEDIRRGIIIRLGNMTDTCFNGATIIGVEEKHDIGGKYSEVWIARPYVYAHEHFDSSSGGLTGVEVFSIHSDSMCRTDTDIEVYESQHYSNIGELRSMLT